MTGMEDSEGGWLTDGETVALYFLDDLLPQWQKKPYLFCAFLFISYLCQINDK